MTNVTMTINGRSVSGTVEGRTLLSTFIRETAGATGTHVGCEQGVCGACSVMIDGAPARSCIAFAVACDGADVKTIEAFDDDPRMGQLRDAFTREHALQCGYCTPGMLISSHDIVIFSPSDSIVVSLNSVPTKQIPAMHQRQGWVNPALLSLVRYS